MKLALSSALTDRRGPPAAPSPPPVPQDDATLLDESEVFSVDDNAGETESGSYAIPASTSKLFLVVTLTKTGMFCEDVTVNGSATTVLSRFSHSSIAEGSNSVREMTTALLEYTPEAGELGTTVSIVATLPTNTIDGIHCAALAMSGGPDFEILTHGAASRGSNADQRSLTSLDFEGVSHPAGALNLAVLYARKDSGSAFTGFTRGSYTTGKNNWHPQGVYTEDNASQRADATVTASFDASGGFDVRQIGGVLFSILPGNSRALSLRMPRGDSHVYTRLPGQTDARVNFHVRYKADDQPASILARIVNNRTGGEVVGWQSVAATFNAGDASCSIDAPISTNFYRLEVRRSDSSIVTRSPHEFRCGLGILWAGQSNMEKFESQGPRTIGVGYGHTIYRGVNENGTGQQWSRKALGGAGVQRFVEYMEAKGFPCSICVTSDAARSINSLSDGGSFWPTIQANIAAFGMPIDAINWVQGENDIDDTSTLNGHAQNIRDVRTDMIGEIADYGTSADFSSVPMVCLNLGPNTKYTDDPTDGLGQQKRPTNHAKITQAHVKAANDDSNIYLAGTRIDASLDDTVHHDGPGFDRLAPRLAEATLHALGVSGAVSPRMLVTAAEVDESTPQTQTIVTFSHGKGTDFTPLDNISGFEMSEDGLVVTDDSSNITAGNSGNFSAPIAVTKGERLSANQILLTHASTSISGYVRFMYGSNPQREISGQAAESGLITDNSEAEASLEPVTVPIAITGTRPATFTEEIIQADANGYVEVVTPSSLDSVKELFVMFKGKASGTRQAMLVFGGNDNGFYVSYTGGNPGIETRGITIANDSETETDNIVLPDDRGGSSSSEYVVLLRLRYDDTIGSERWRGSISRWQSGTWTTVEDDTDAKLFTGSNLDNITWDQLTGRMFTRSDAINHQFTGKFSRLYVNAWDTVGNAPDPTSSTTRANFVADDTTGELENPSTARSAYGTTLQLLDIYSLSDLRAGTSGGVATIAPKNTSGDDDNTVYSTAANWS